MYIIYMDYSGYPIHSDISCVLFYTAKNAKASKPCAKASSPFAAFESLRFNSVVQLWRYVYIQPIDEHQPLCILVSLEAGSNLQDSSDRVRSI